jgi:pimeloyl-ACP methyl ester carboxylesterase
VFRSFASSSWRVAVAAVVFSACAAVSTGARAGGSHLYVMLGLGGMSPGLSDFGDRIGHHGIPTTVGSYTEWDAFAQQAIHDYKSGRVSSIMIVGHSLGGGAARAMAAELAEAHVPVKLLISLDPVGETDTSSNVRRAVTILPGAGEDHFSMITAHERELRGLVLGTRGPRQMRARAPEAVPDNFSYGTPN